MIEHEVSEALLHVLGVVVGIVVGHNVIAKDIFGK